MVAKQLEDMKAEAQQQSLAAKETIAAKEEYLQEQIADWQRKLDRAEEERKQASTSLEANQRRVEALEQQSNQRIQTLHSELTQKDAAYRKIVNGLKGDLT